MAAYDPKTRSGRKGRVLYCEGVPYERYVLRFRLTDGRRRSRVFWSPGPPWVFSEAHRLLEGDGFLPPHIMPRSGTLTQEDPKPRRAT